MTGIFVAQVLDLNDGERYEVDWIDAIRKVSTPEKKGPLVPNRYTLDDILDLHYISNTNKKKIGKLSSGKFIDIGKQSSISRQIIYHITQEELDHEAEIDSIMNQIREVNAEIKKKVPELLAYKAELEKSLRKLRKRGP